MLPIRYSILPHGEKWKLCTEGKQLGVYEAQETAIEAGRRAAAQAKRSGLDAELQILNYYGELSQIELDKQDAAAAPPPSKARTERLDRLS